VSIPVTLAEVLIAFGAVIVLWAWFQAFDRNGRAVGTIVRITRRCGPDGDDMAAPEIAFDVEGTKYTIQPSLVLPSEASRKSIGRKLCVAYNPDDPADADVASPARLYLPGAIVTALYSGYLYWYVANHW
jgi:hypothetical protein